MKYTMKSPCPQCPFRTDNRFYLRPGRVRAIAAALVRGEFPCHKTAEHDEEGDWKRTGDEVHCAGALILLEKSGRPSQMMRIAERLGIYDRRTIDMEAPVFASFGAMASAQEERR